MKLTVENLIYEWLKWRQKKGMREICTHDMENLRKWVSENFNIMHTAATYERIFRKIRSKYPYRFRDVSNRYPDRNYKTWEIKQKEKENA